MENENIQNQKVRKSNHPGIRWTLLLYDVIAIGVVSFLLIYIFLKIQNPLMWIHVLSFVVVTVISRIFWLTYTQVWRYGGVACYLRLLLADATAGAILYFIELAIDHFTDAGRLNFIMCAAVCGINLGIAFGMRFIYRYAYKNMRKEGWFFSVLRVVLKVFAGLKIDEEKKILDIHKTKVAIVGAGRTGCSLAEEIGNNLHSGYEVKCFIDNAKDKIGRIIFNAPVLDEMSLDKERLYKLGIEEVIFAMPDEDNQVKAELYKKYKDMGYKIRLYDYPYMATASGNNKKQLRDFDIEELLFREPVKMFDANTYCYYKDKIIMITGVDVNLGSAILA